MSRTASLVVTPFVVAIVLGGCGGGDGAPITTIGEATDGALNSPSRDDFIEQADDICAEANVAIANLGALATGEQGTASQEHQITRSALEQLESLPAPKDDLGSLDRFLSALGAVVDLLDRQAVATERADDAAITEISGELSVAQSEARAAAAAYGFKHCGSTDAEATTSSGGDTGTSSSASTSADPTAVTPTAPTTPPPAPVEPPATTPPPPPTGASGGEPSPTDGGGDTGGTGGISPGGGVSP